MSPGHLRELFADSHGPYRGRRPPTWRDHSGMPVQRCPIECFAKGSARFFPTSARAAAPCLVPRAEVLHRLERAHFSLRNRQACYPGHHQLLRGEADLGHVTGIRAAPPNGAQPSRGRHLPLLPRRQSAEKPMKGTINRFAGVPFLQDGVGCERCHGPGSDHVNRAGPMVNSAKLTGEQQDSICMQCHLEGEARIVKAARSQRVLYAG